MTAAQQELALALMATGLSERGTRRARQIIALETVLRVEEHIERPGQERCDRNPLRCYVSVERGFGKGHYYNVKGPTFMLEYDNTENDANHIHSVWRDYTNDWGEDLLAEHLSSHHR